MVAVNSADLFSLETNKNKDGDDNARNNTDHGQNTKTQVEPIDRLLVFEKHRSRRRRRRVKKVQR